MEHGSMDAPELAERLGYTDKAVSKWERGESLPDVTVLISIAETLGVSLDKLCGMPDAPLTKEESAANKQKNRKLITCLSCIGVVLLSAIASVILIMLDAGRHLLPFVWAPVGVAAVLLIFSLVWGQRRFCFLYVSLLVWLIPAAIIVTIGSLRLLSLLLIIPPLQIAVIIWSKFRKT